MSASIGAILQKERESRGLSLGQAAEATHIRVERLRELEVDDFSHFPNPAYARMYFRLYCKYLDIQVTDEIHLLFPGALAGLDDYEYMRNDPVPRAPRADRPPRPRRSLAFLATVLGMILVIVLVIGASLAWTIQRVGGWSQEFVDRAKVIAEERRKAAEEKLRDPTLIDADAEQPAVPEDQAATPKPVAPIDTLIGVDGMPAPADKEARAAAEKELLSVIDGPAALTTDDGTEIPPETPPATEGTAPAPVEGAAPMPAPGETTPAPVSTETAPPAPEVTPATAPESGVPPAAIPTPAATLPPPSSLQPMPEAALPPPDGASPAPEPKKEEPKFSFPEAG